MYIFKYDLCTFIISVTVLSLFRYQELGQPIHRHCSIHVLKAGFRLLRINRYMHKFDLLTMDLSIIQWLFDRKAVVSYLFCRHASV